MKHRSMILLGAVAAVAAAIVLPAALLRGAPPSAPPAPIVRIVAPTPPASNRVKTTQMRGFSMQLNDPKATASYLRAIDELADMGCTWINLAVAARQDNVKSESVALHWDKVPSQPDILKVMAKAKSRGMGVMMMPMVLLINTGTKDWRGIIEPAGGSAGWDNWFATYRTFITDMAALAQKADVDIFCVGSELLSTEPFRDRWVETISEIKKVYRGKLTYSANWDHYESVTFWDQLDYVGMNNYNELAKKPGVPVSELNKTWEPIKKNVLAFAAKQKKPFMFTEVGWHNLVNTLAEPWNYVATGAVDHREQLHAFESFVQTWQNVPNEQFMGAFIWEWCPDGRVTDHGTYSLQDTPALDVVKKWFIAP